MPYRNNTFEKDQLFHITSRAVDERKIFEQEDDNYRFIFQIYAANIGKPGLNLWKKDTVKAAKDLLNGNDLSSRLVIKEHSPLVDILDFSLNVTHYHFYLKSNIEGGVPLFIKKLNGGFAMFFNFKHGRKGTLFSGRYKSISVDNENQADAVSRYVAIVNPLDVYQPGWRENGIKDWRGANKFLEEYEFSSFPDKIGRRKSKILASQEILQEYSFLNKLSHDDYSEFVKDFLKEKLSTYNNASFLE